MSLPESSTGNYKRKEYADRTYLVDRESMCVSGETEGLDAVRQAADIILSVERFEYQIYSTDFGREFDGILGKESEYAQSMLKRRITEALSVDKRILSVDNFSFREDGEELYCSFDIRTVFGTAEKEVKM